MEKLANEEEKVALGMEALKKRDNNVNYANWEVQQVKTKLGTLVTTSQDVTRAETQLRLKTENFHKQQEFSSAFTEGLKLKMGTIEQTKEQLEKRIAELDAKLKSDPKIGRDLEQEIADLSERVAIMQEINDRQKMKMTNY